MNKMLEKLIETDFMTTEAALVLEKNIEENNPLIISGHRGHGTLPLLATLGTVAKEKFTLKPLKEFNKEQSYSEDYLLIGDLKEVNYEELYLHMFNTSQRFIGLKDSDHPFSIIKLLKESKKNQGANHKYIVVECTKIDDLKQLKKITEIYFDENNKLIRKDIS